MPYVTRNAYTPSSGASSSPPSPDSFWTDAATFRQNYAGVWDTPSGTADAVISVTGSATTSAHQLILCAQHKFPAFGSGPVGAANNGLYSAPIARARFSKTKISGGSNLFVKTAGVFSVYSSSNVLKFYLAPVGQVPTAGVGQSVNNGASYLGVRFASLNGLTTNAVLSTDYLVVETGFDVWLLGPVPGGTSWTFTADMKLGDSYSIYDVPGSSANGNSGFVYEWFASSVSASGDGWKYSTPEMPTRAASIQQSPGIPERNSDLLNEFVLN